MEIEKAVDDVLVKFFKNGVTEEEFNRVRVSIKASDVYGQDSPFNLVYRMGQWIISGGTTDNFGDWINILDNGISISSMMETARKWINPTQTTTGYLVNNKGQL